jgi:peptide/nickel transport system ATP-binding protein
MQFEAERAAIGDLTVLDSPAVKARLEAGPAHRAADVVALLEAVREEDPAEPFWTGVNALRPDGGHVDVEWHEPMAPRPLVHGDVTVECHLYDDEALAEAARRRGGVVARSE